LTLSFTQSTKLGNVGVTFSHIHLNVLLFADWKINSGATWAALFYGCE